MKDLHATAKAAMEASELGVITLVELVFSSSITYRYALATVDITHRGYTWAATMGANTEIQETIEREGPTAKVVLQNIDGVLAPLVDGTGSGVDLRRKRVTLYEVEPSQVGLGTDRDIATTFIVEDYRITGEAVALSIGTGMAVVVMVPSRTIQPYTCGARFGDAECGAIPGKTTPFKTCPRTLAACKERWPGQALPFMAFPGSVRRSFLRV